MHACIHFKYLRKLEYLHTYSTYIHIHILFVFHFFALLPANILTPPTTFLFLGAAEDDGRASCESVCSGKSWLGSPENYSNIHAHTYIHTYIYVLIHIHTFMKLKNVQKYNYLYISMYGFCVLSVHVYVLRKYDA